VAEREHVQRVAAKAAAAAAAAARAATANAAAKAAFDAQYGPGSEAREAHEADQVARFAVARGKHSRELWRWAAAAAAARAVSERRAEVIAAPFRSRRERQAGGRVVIAAEVEEVFREKQVNDVVSAVGLSLPGVTLVTWTIPGVINWCFDCKMALREKCQPYSAAVFNVVERHRIDAVNAAVMSSLVAEHDAALAGAVARNADRAARRLEAHAARQRWFKDRDDAIVKSLAAWAVASGASSVGLALITTLFYSQNII
jgi:hypothetical protein